jgi:acyl dehydratase
VTLSATAARVGLTHEAVVVENLSRAQIIQYAGASGDFSPQHVDEVWSTEVAGTPTVFAHGMLTMGLTGRMLTDWLGARALRSFGLRFAAPVWPGDTLRARGTITDVELDGARAIVTVDVATRNTRDVVVATGTATARLRA